jgi:hypothetical protein
MGIACLFDHFQEMIERVATQAKADGFQWDHFIGGNVSQVYIGTQ